MLPAVPCTTTPKPHGLRPLRRTRSSALRIYPRRNAGTCRACSHRRSKRCSWRRGFPVFVRIVTVRIATRRCRRHPRKRSRALPWQWTPATGEERPGTKPRALEVGRDKRPWPAKHVRGKRGIAPRACPGAGNAVLRALRAAGRFAPYRIDLRSVPGERRGRPQRAPRSAPRLQRGGQPAADRRTVWHGGHRRASDGRAHCRQGNVNSPNPSILIPHCLA
jgi:hypothetical protein